MQERHFESDECDEHKSYEHSAGQLQQTFGFVLAQGRHSGEEGTTFTARLGEHKQKCSDECEVAEEEVHVPDDVVGERLQHDNEEEHAARDLDLPPSQDHYAASDLTDEIHQHEDHREELSTAPGHVHVFTLLVPLEPHPQAVLQERCDETQPGKSWQHMFAMSDHLQNQYLLDYLSLGNLNLI